MAFLIARKNRAAVAAAATVTERTVAFADINLMLSRGKSSFKTPPSSDLGKNLQRLPSLGLPFSREQRSSPEADPDAGCPPWSSPPLCLTRARARTPIFSQGRNLFSPVLPPGQWWEPTPLPDPCESQDTHLLPAPKPLLPPGQTSLLHLQNLEVL